MYFDREWVYDRASQQFKERSSSGGYHAFRRGVTEATIRALLQQLNNACYIIQSLVRCLPPPPPPHETRSCLGGTDTPVCMLHLHTTDNLAKW